MSMPEPEAFAIPVGNDIGGVPAAACDLPPQD